MNGWWLDYNLRVVLAGTAMLGAASGMIGVFLLLRRRALIGDAISHATLPGVCVAFCISYALGSHEKSLIGLLLGAAISGTLGALAIVGLRHWTKLKEDAALGIVLSTFFGAGVALLRIIQTLPAANAAGLEGFIYGKTALMIAEDAYVIGIVGLVLCCSVFFLQKELKLLCFDSGYASSQGWPTVWLDLLLMISVVSVVIVGLQAVGLILVIAMLIIPAASARFWTYHLGTMIAIAASMGCISGVLGALASSHFDRLPSGAAIVLTALLFFLLSLAFGKEGGLCWRVRGIYFDEKRVDRSHVLRGIYELLDMKGIGIPVGALQTEEVSANELQQLRTWPTARLSRTIRQLIRDGSVVGDPLGKIALTAKGIRLSRESVRMHRLLELYLLRQAELTGEAVDRGADMIEHSVDDQVLTLLEREFGKIADVPASIHPLNPGASPHDR